MIDFWNTKELPTTLRRLGCLMALRSHAAQVVRSFSAGVRPTCRHLSDRIYFLFLFLSDTDVPSPPPPFLSHSCPLSVWLVFSLCLTLSFFHRLTLFVSLLLQCHHMFSLDPSMLHLIASPNFSVNIQSSLSHLPLTHPRFVSLLHILSSPSQLPYFFLLLLFFSLSLSLLSCSQNYFKDAWNIFDCVTVLGSVTDILVTELGVRSRIWYIVFVDVLELYWGVKTVHRLTWYCVRNVCWVSAKLFVTMCYLSFSVCLWTNTSVTWSPTHTVDRTIS